MDAVKNGDSFPGDMHEALVNKGDSHFLPENVTERKTNEDGARCRFRTYDPYRVKVMLYH